MCDPNMVGIEAFTLFHRLFELFQKKGGLANDLEINVLEKHYYSTRYS